MQAHRAVGDEDEIFNQAPCFPPGLDDFAVSLFIYLLTFKAFLCSLKLILKLFWQWLGLGSVLRASRV